MPDRSLIVARMDPARSAEVAGLFAESDRTDLPAVLGVRRRHLFRYGDGLYFHYVEFDGDRTAALRTAAGRGDFRSLSADLDAYIQPYDPATWHSPADAMATEFYRWER